MNQDSHLRADQWIPAAVGAVLIAFLAIVTFFLLTEHRAHTFGVLPWLLLLAFPLLHPFMHRVHGKRAWWPREPPRAPAELLAWRKTMTHTTPSYGPRFGDSRHLQTKGDPS